MLSPELAGLHNLTGPGQRKLSSRCNFEPGGAADDTVGGLLLLVDCSASKHVVSEKGNEKRLTGGGISSGLDESLQLILLLFGKKVAKDVQETTQYFPKPPVKGKLPHRPPKCEIVWS